MVSNAVDWLARAVLTRAGATESELAARKLAEPENGRNYFLPAFFFAAQKAFNLADNFALVARLIVFFIVFAAGLIDCVAG